MSLILEISLIVIVLVLCKQQCVRCSDLVGLSGGQGDAVELSLVGAGHHHLLRGADHQRHDLLLLGLAGLLAARVWRDLGHTHTHTDTYTLCLEVLEPAGAHDQIGFLLLVSDTDGQQITLICLVFL